MENIAHQDKFIRIEYPTIYEDKNGQERVKMVHKHLAPEATLSGTLNYTELFVVVRGVKFSVCDFEEFELDETENALSKLTFAFKERQGSHILWDCCFRVDIPIQVFVGSKISMATLRVITQLGEKSDKDGFSLSLNLICEDMQVETSGRDTGFKQELQLLQEQIRGKLSLKCCATCLFSSYHLLGQNSFGDMMCFSHHRDIYLSTPCRTKAEFFEMLSKMEYYDDMRYVAETFLCDDYVPKNQNVGHPTPVFS